MTDRTISVVSWNIAKKRDPQFELANMPNRGEVDLALLQEAGKPPSEIADRLHYKNDPTPWVSGTWWCNCPTRWRSSGSGRFLRRKSTAERMSERAVSGRWQSRVVPCGQEEDAFLAVSRYARWTQAHPITGKRPGIHAGVSVHRILFDLQTFMDYLEPSRYRMLAAGELNLCYGATKRSWYERARRLGSLRGAWPRVSWATTSERQGSVNHTSRKPRAHPGRSDLSHQPPNTKRGKPSARLRLCIPWTP